MQASLRSAAAALAPVVLALLVGCSTAYGPGPLGVGQPRDAVLARMGEPTGQYTLQGGATRLEFARGPMGLHTYMIDLGADGRVQALAQVLTEPRFNAIVAGQTRDDVQAAIGRPSVRRPGGWQGGEVWAWRYDSLFCTWFMASMTDDGRVRDTAYGPDPRCDDPVDGK